MNNWIKASLIIFLIVGLLFFLQILTTGGLVWALLMTILYYVGLSFVFRPWLMKNQ